MKLMTRKRKDESEDAPGKKSRSQDRHISRRTFRIPPELYDDLKAVAEFNERPMAWEIKVALKKHLAQIKKIMEQQRDQPPL